MKIELIIGHYLLQGHAPLGSERTFQKFIMEQRLEGETYESICSSFFERFGIHLYDNKLSKALKRASMGYFWEPGMKGGTDPYLCSEDFHQLKELVKDSQEFGHPLDCTDVIDEAQRIKMNRIHEAIYFLKQANSNNLVHKLNKYFINPPSRPWINGVLEELESHIINRRLIDEKRLDSCSKEVVENFFLKFSDFIRSFKKFLFFGADETMVEVLPRKSYVVPDDVKVVFHEKYPDMKHISVDLSF